EIKSRILESLSELKERKKNGYQKELEKELGLTENELADKSSRLLKSILHQYHLFSVSTLDSLFQKMVRAFVLELQISSFRYDLETDLKSVFSEEIIPRIWAEAADEEKLKNSITTLSSSRLNEDKDWNINDLLGSFGTNTFEKTEQMNQTEFEPDLEGLEQRYHEMLEEQQDPKEDPTIRLLHSSGYLMSIAKHFTSHIKNYRDEKDILFVSDLAKLLHQVTKANIPAYIYEKLGTRFHHYLIDEVQDTSSAQWEAIKPLIGENITGGYESILVGDPKQSVYRWRNAEPDLFLKQIPEEDFPEHHQVHSLEYNWRSLPTLIKFNNNLFDAYKHVQTQKGPSLSRISKVFEKHEQEIPKTHTSSKEEGWVHLRIQSFRGTKLKGEAQKDAFNGWLLDSLGEIRDKGYEEGDIMILVRTNQEMKDISSILLRENYKVVSKAVFSMDSSPLLRLLIALLKTHLFTKDKYTKYLYTLINIEYELAFPGRPIPSQAEFVERRKEIDKDRLSLQDQIESWIRFLELDEKSTDKNSPSHSFAFLDSFIDLLEDFQKRGSGTLRDLILFWEKKKDQSLAIPHKKDAIRVQTVHDAKGLEAEVVILPWADFSSRQDNRNPNFLWSDDEKTYFGMKSVPFEAIKNKVKGTPFLSRLEREEEDRKIDSLNLLYVAMTRARRVLKGYFPFGSRFGQDGPKYLHEVLQWMEKEGKGSFSTIPLVGDPSDTQSPWCYEIEQGSPPTPTPTPKEKEEETPQKKYHPTRIDPKKTGFPFVSKKDRKKIKSDAKNKIVGTGVHEVFQHLGKPEDLERCLRNLFRKEEYRTYGEDIEKRFQLVQKNTEILSLCFPQNKDEILRTEMSMFDGKGNELRCDRVLLNPPSHARIIDFKTGKQDPKDQEQIQEYGICLQKLGYQSELYICYLGLTDINVISVPMP
ncbi:MAG: UvrD-helicase domain-containing protein, partial [Cytophagales bacterium]|nr:UvrD-helicase domain-containing protein [Cytophagales bacterium]